jgi:hypothetical protein
LAAWKGFNKKTTCHPESLDEIRIAGSWVISLTNSMEFKDIEYAIL